MRPVMNIRNILYFIMLSITSGIVLTTYKNINKLTPEQKESLKEIKDLEKAAKKLCDEIKRHKNDKEWLDDNEERLQVEYDRIYNAYKAASKNGAIRIINMYNKAHEETKKESACVIETKLNIYEAYDNGYITESEKNDLLYMVNESFADDVKKHADEYMKKNTDKIKNIYAPLEELEKKNNIFAQKLKEFQDGKITLDELNKYID